MAGGLEPDDLEGPSQPEPFYDSIICEAGRVEEETWAALPRLRNAAPKSMELGEGEFGGETVAEPTPAPEGAGFAAPFLADSVDVGVAGCGIASKCRFLTIS